MICFTARILQRFQKCYPQGHPRSPKKSSPNTFFSAQVAGRNFSYFCLLKCDSGTREYKKSHDIGVFGIFLTFMSN